MPSAPVTSHRPFEPGTTGWSVEDLYDPEILSLWSRGRYEIVDGVLTKMPPQGFQGVDPLASLRDLLMDHLRRTGRKGRFYNEVDVLLRNGRIARPDMLFLSEQQRRQQRKLARDRGLTDADYRPVYVAPRLVVESICVGHEAHDRETKLEWYADAGVPHYWLLTAHERSLACLALKRGEYVEEDAGRDSDTIRSAIFGGVSIPLAKLWA